MLWCRTCAESHLSELVGFMVGPSAERSGLTGEGREAAFISCTDGAGLVGGRRGGLLMRWLCLSCLPRCNPCVCCSAGHRGQRHDRHTRPRAETQGGEGAEVTPVTMRSGRRAHEMHVQGWL